MIAERQSATASPLNYDATPDDTVLRFCEQSYDGRIFDPLSDPDASANLISLRQTWAEEGKTTVFTSGGFDLGPHGNHRSYLKGMRVISAPYHYAEHDSVREGKDWGDLTKAQKLDYVNHVVSSGSIKLIVSVDGDAALDRRKSGDVTKGSTQRPFFSWETRIRGILELCDVVDGQPHLTVDAVTIHDNQLPELSETPHAGIMEIGAFVKPDVWGIFFESRDIIEYLEADTTARYNGITPVILSPGVMYNDKFVGPLSTTKIAEHIGNISDDVARNRQDRVE